MKLLISEYGLRADTAWRAIAVITLSVIALPAGTEGEIAIPCPGIVFKIRSVTEINDLDMAVRA